MGNFKKVFEGDEFKKRVEVILQKTLISKSWVSYVGDRYCVEFAPNDLFEIELISDELKAKDLKERYRLGYLDRALQRMVITFMGFETGEGLGDEYEFVAALSKVNKVIFGTEAKYLVWFESSIAPYYSGEQEMPES